MNIHSPILRIALLASFAMSPGLLAKPPSGPSRGKGVAAASGATNLLQNGDFSGPINTERKRGKWILLVSQKGSEGFDMVTSGFKTENNTLEIDVAQLAPSDSATAIQLSQLIPPLITGGRYRLSFDAKSTEEGAKLLVGVGVMTAGRMEGALEMQTELLSTEMRSFSYEFTAAAMSDSDLKKLRLDFRPGKSTGVVSLQNVQLIQLE